jgi:hypothetical protein
MRNDKLIPGMILVMIGAIFLLHNFGYIHFHWYNLFHLWPIFLVIGGVNLVFANNRSAWATILKISVVIAGFALLVFGNFSNRYSSWWWPRYTYHHNSDDNNDMDDNDDSDDDDSSGDHHGLVKVLGTNTFNDPYNANVKVAQLNISGGATSYSLDDTTNQMFNAVAKETFGTYEFNHHQDDSVYVIDFKMKDHNSFEFHGDNNNNENRVDIKLNPNPIWNMQLDAGATDVNFDLSKFKVKSIKLNGGAGSFAIKLGQPLSTTNINISTGAASVKFTIPQNAACRITKSSALSSDDFEGFTKKDNGDYETPNFDAAKNKFYISFSGAMSGFEVKRY